MLRPYLQIVRITGIFTAFSNVLVGFFVSQQNDLASLVPLLFVSGFLYMAGMVLNDYFDYNVDKKERPYRPLPSGRIPKNVAFLLGFSFLISANVIASLTSTQTMTLSLLMSCLIVGYDLKIKTAKFFGIFFLSIIRFLNVLLGTSLLQINFENALIAIPIAVFISGISVLAKTETTATSKTAMTYNIASIIFTVSYVVLIVGKFEYLQIIFISVFTILSLIPYRIQKNKIQKIVTFQLLSIVLLDASLLVVFADIYVPIITALLYIPALFLGRKIYVT
jgi:4-hydroxybenzoate polyprenyltransferase